MRALTLRRAHKYIGLVIGIQLLMWTVSGLFFSLNPIARVRGETETTEPRSLDSETAYVSPKVAIDQLTEKAEGLEIMSIVLRPHLGGAVYEIRYRDQGHTRWATADARSGVIRAPLDEAEAVAVARQDFSEPAAILAVDLITETASGSEYRGRPLPAYRVTFDHSLGTRLYVSTDRAAVTARRNNRWRWFDLFWALHIMDYGERDDFNTLWLQLIAGLGVVTVVSGYALALVTSIRVRAAKRRLLAKKAEAANAGESPCS